MLGAAMGTAALACQQVHSVAAAARCRAASHTPCWPIVLALIAAADHIPLGTQLCHTRILCCPAEGITLPFKAVALITEHGRTRLDVTVKASSGWLFVRRGKQALQSTSLPRCFCAALAAAFWPPLLPPCLCLLWRGAHLTRHCPCIVMHLHTARLCRSRARSPSSCLPPTWCCWCRCPTRRRAPPSTSPRVGFLWVCACICVCMRCVDSEGFAHL